VTNLDGPRLRSTVHVRFAGAAGDVVVQALDLAGFATSTGAACTSGSVAPSGVLRALGLSPDQAAEGVRLSLGVDSTAAEIEALLEVLPAIIERARQFG
jgi:cysteine desulfurase